MQHQATHARKDDGESNRVSLPLRRIATAWRSLPRLRGGIGLRLLVRVLLFSAAITLLLTLMQLYLDYRRDVGAIDQRISEIDSGYRRSLGEGLWRLDARQLQLQAEGILHLPDIHYVELREATDSAAPLVVTAGSRQANPPLRREFRISYTNHGVEQLVGILVVEATFDMVYRRLLDSAAVILVGQAIMTFIVSFFILLIVHRLITRHLTGIATSLRGYDLHGSRAPLRLDRRRPPPADELDRLVEAFNDMYARLQAAYGDIAEREKQLIATSEVLRTIANAPSDIQSALDAVAEHAARLCGASNARIWRLEDNALRLVATYGESSATMDGREGLPADRDTVTGRAACDRRTIHVHDIAAEDSEYPLGSRIVKGQGWHTTLATPLLREGTPIGIILVRRMEVRPFHDQQIALLEIFADQAAIAIENVRLFEAEKQRSVALAHANRDLAEREAKIRRLVDSNVIGIFIWDFEGRFLEANDEFLRMVGYDREDLLAGSMRWTDLTPPDWRDRSNTRMERQKSSGRFDPFEKEYTRKDGSRVPVLIGGATFEVGGNEGVAFVLDLTARKCAEEALRESEYKLRQIIETVPSHLWSANSDFEPTHLNQHLLDYFGRRFEDFKQGGWEAFLHPDDLPETAKALSHAVETGTYFQVVHRLRRADGEYRWHHARGEPLRDRQGRIIQWYGLSVDVDEAKKTEDQLRRSESYLAEAQRLSHCGSAAYTQTRMHYFSEEACRMYGFDPLQGTPSREAVRQRIHPDDRDRTLESIERAVREKRDFVNEYRIIRPDGTIRHVEANNHPVFLASGELLEIVATGIDVTERKRADDALRESEYKLRQIIDTIPTHVVRYRPDGVADFMNKTFGEFVGPGVGFENLESAVHPEDYPKRSREWDTHIAAAEPYDIEMRLRRVDGVYRWHRSRRVPLRDASGAIVNWYGAGHDIDDQMQAEQALRRSEAHLAEAERLSHTGAVAYNGTAILFASEETYRIWGFDPAQGLPSRDVVFQRIHPGDRDRLNAEVRREVRGKRRYSIGYRIVLPDGTVKHLETIGQPVFSASGELVEIFATQTDVTERKRAEEALRESEAKIRRLVDSNIIGIFIWDFDGRILEANDEFLRMLSYDREDLVSGRIRWAELTPPDWRDRNNARIEQQKGGGRFEPFEKEYTRKDGRRVPVLIGGATFEEGGNQGVAYVLDLTVRKRVEAEARESEQRYRTAQLELAHANRVATMGQLTASITHEVNQPITAAVTYASAARRLLSAEPPNLHEVDDVLSLIVKEGNRAGEVVGRIRALIKKAPPRKDAVEINDAIIEIVALTRTEAANNSVSVRTQLAENLPRIQGDRVQLQQVLLNLIINAIEAMRDAGEEERELLISTRHEPDGVSVEVRDSGPGFAPADIDRVFEAFYSTKPSGVGLGLSICRSIIETHNGRLWASPNVPRGAVFGFIAPAHPAAAS